MGRAFNFAFLFLTLSQNLGMAHAAAEMQLKASSHPVALIYAGKGICPKACEVAVALSVKAAGLVPKLIDDTVLAQLKNPDQLNKLFKDAQVWVQPGGYAKESSVGMGTPLQHALRHFVRTGGGYVGFCAGAFLATDRIGVTGEAGLGLLHAKTATFLANPARPELIFSIENILWQGRETSLYFEGGPFFYDLNSEVEVVATYQDRRSPAAVRGRYGQGRVYLSGPHPEALSSWWKSDGVEFENPDGEFLAASMIRWAARLE